MDVFNLDHFVIEQYKAFSRSFTKIRSPEIASKVDALYDDKRFWPEPLLQINPHYASGGSIRDFVKGGILEPECLDIFTDKWGPANQEDPTLKLRKHQEQAISFAKDRQSYVVTTGTGSGKSLCFFIPIIDAAIRAKKAGGGAKTRAIIVYPMNALANSQAKELEGYLGSATGGLVTYARYTGQESAEDRELIKANPPDILLTNFMMLELLMTRQSDLDRKVLQNCEGLQFIVLDELHTYRGRQGADVAMLMRRLRSRIGDPQNPPLCIGTSATMASEGAQHEKNEAVARIAGQIFGADIGPDAVVTETLKRVTNPIKIGSSGLPGLKEAVQQAAQGEVAIGLKNSDFFDDPLAIWVETKIGLKNVETKPERAKPISLEDAANSLSQDSGLPAELCASALRETLIGYSIPEKDRVAGSQEHSPLFAFKLHQFVAGAGRLYMTLRPEGHRDVTFSGQIFNPINDEERLYPTHFCRSCGQEFHPVTLRNYDGMEVFEKREIDDIPVDGDEDDEGADWGFLMPQPNDDEFTFSGKDEDYPDAWLDEKPNGEKRLKPTYRKKRAQQYSVRPDGTAHSGMRQAWFLPGKYRFCPSCRDVNISSARDMNKLASLSAESRSSATTILLSTVLRWMNSPDSTIQKHSRKLLAFTDNRQDAALQAGHFNDFVFVTMLRGAIINALRQAPGGVLEEANIGQEVQRSLQFLAASEFSNRADEWLVNTGVKGERRNDAEAILRQNLQHLFWVDQRRGWRYTNPNLEQLGLLVARYKYLDDIASDEGEFVASPILSNASPEERKRALKAVYDHMRKGLAVDSGALNRLKLEELSGKNHNLIKSPWNIEEDRIVTSTIFMTDPPKRKEMKNKDEDKLLRGSPTSTIGRKIRDMTFAGRRIELKEVPEVMEGLLKASENYGSVVKEAGPFGGMGWRLAGSTVQFALDEAHENAELQNEYFVGVYLKIAEMLEAGGETLFGFEGREHTAQVEGDLRELREMRFRYGSDDRKSLIEAEEKLKNFKEDSRFLPTLFCSPTMELGVDISAMNVVYLRNAPPTAANYAQRSGRAGRSGQAALILTYCAAQSPHDQYFFERKTDLVDGVVVPPSIDLKNRDLVESHLNAEWLASLGMELKTDSIELDKNIKSNLDLTDPAKALLPEIRDVASAKRTAERASPLIDGVLKALEKDYAGDYPRWFKTRQQVTQNIVAQAPARFNETFNRWRDLLKAAERSIELADQALKDYTISPPERKAAEERRRMGEFQRSILLSNQSNKDNDFYLYRYLATEGFLPGYNFPRLPLMAYVQGGNDGRNQRYIQRARFLAISEFGPQSLVYHEGRAFRVDRALLKEAGDRDDGYLSTKARALCPSCGASHDGEHPERCHVCNTALSKSVPLTNLYKIENVGTRPAERITSNDEERKRQGFEIQTTFAFDASSYTASMAVTDDDGDIITVDYAQAAYISRINKGLRRRKDKSQIGFFINPKTGVWVGQPKDDGSDEERPDKLTQLIVPLVEDRKNALLIRFDEEWFAELGKESDKTLTTLQHALARGIEAVFQLEEGEILVEPTPSRQDRRALLFYEAAEGGAGALGQMISEKDSIALVARKALEIMHFEASSFDAAKKDVSALVQKPQVECVAGCYRCVLSYFNQPDHEHIERRDEDMQKMLLRLAFSTTSPPQETRRDPAPMDGVSVTSAIMVPDDFVLPQGDNDPLIIAGQSIKLVWRKKRIVALDDEHITDELQSALTAKGVTLFSLPPDPNQRAVVMDQLKAALKE
ncbi:DEAD/DEAH box helicase [Yoonia vestfoldensis]|uniref:Probable ATP-dependent helicase Lhr n=1 Tax=Yoonia vestfoldensis SKA53 TaxID=314232 RepID=A3V5V1_9RHOB|nr:DEAD/DEAH box helicase [Yoonia vestfoldensis]EAQ06275.1 Probable ATP-dependent helicase Lhr [Yoonia vestfoldensis SKA53]